MEPITVSVDEATRLTGLGRNRVYDLINNGSLESFKLGRRRLIRVSSIKRLLDEALAA